VDRDAALELLTQAVAAFNERDKTEKPGDNPIRISGPTPDAAETSLRANSSGFFMTLVFVKIGELCASSRERN
jgi:hypothetical protein